MRLNSADWKVISRVMLSLVLQSLENKQIGAIDPSSRAESAQEKLLKVKQELGELTDQEQILVRMVL